MYSFEVEWPLPFKSGWQRSGNTFPTMEEAAKAMGDLLIAALINDCQIAGRLVKI